MTTLAASIGAVGHFFSVLIPGLFMFMFLVIIHELWHFAAARKFWVSVLEFWLGIPPKIKKLFTDKKGTEYTLNAIPLWGFVRLKGEDPHDPQTFHAKDSFIKAKLLPKIIILLGGITMNLLAAWVIFTIVFTVGTRPISILPQNAVPENSHSYLMPTMQFLQDEGFVDGNMVTTDAQITEVLPWMLGDKIGLLSGDVIVSINEQSVNSRNVWSVLQRFISQPIRVTYQRNGTIQQTYGECDDDNCLLWVMLYTTGMVDVKPIRFSLPMAMLVSLKEMRAQTDLTFAALGRLGKGLISFNKEKIQTSLGKLTGPAGAIKFGDMLLREGGWILFLAFAGMISLALALFNVLPIPALDGGRIVGVLIQGVLKLKPEAYFKIEGYINLVFFVLLMWLGVYILLKDLVRFWGVDVPFVG